MFALTLEEGDGEELTSAKLGHPRWFTHWREDAGWELESLEHVAGTGEDWLHVVARRPTA